MELSALSPLLNANDVWLVAVGLEELGLEDFIKGEYFSGEIFLDVNQLAYKALGYRRYNVCTMLMCLFNKTVRDAAAKVTLP
jgi:hypothetical protein